MFLLLVTIPPSDGWYDGQVILDGREDVVKYQVRERSASGYPELDILSLETFERVTRIEAYLSLDSDISSELGYLYTITICGVEASYDNGTVSVMDIKMEEDITEDVEVEKMDDQLFISVPRNLIDAEASGINGSAVLYDPDSGPYSEGEFHYDRVEGSTGTSVTPYQVRLDDPDGDVRYNYIETGVGNNPDIDITKIKAESSSAGIRMEMYLSGQPFSSGDEEYTFNLGPYGFRFGSEGPQQVSGDPVSITDSGFDDGMLRIETGIPSLEPGFLLHGRSKTAVDEDGWQEDICPDEPGLQLDILPFSTGSVVDLTLSISADGIVELKLSTYDYDPATEALIIDSLDMDSSGSIDDDEIDSILDPIEEGLLDSPPLLVDGEANELDIDLSGRGLTDQSSLRMDLTVSIRMDLDDEVSHTIEVAPFRILSAFPGEEEIYCDLFIKVPEGMSILALTLSPGELGNHLSLDRKTIESSSGGIQDLNMMTGGLSFDIGRDEIEEDPSDEVVYEDIPTWVYVVTLLVIIVIVVMILRVTFRKEDPPKDY